MNGTASAEPGEIQVRIPFDPAWKAWQSGDGPLPGGSFSEDDLKRLRQSSTPDRLVAVELAAKEACCRWIADRPDAPQAGAAEFRTWMGPDGRLRVEPSLEILAWMSRRLIAGIDVAITCDEREATAVARAVEHPLQVPWFGPWIYRLFPFRRRVTMSNLNRAFGTLVPQAQLRRLACAYYAHLMRSMLEMGRLPLMSERRRADWVRVENKESPIGAHRPDRGLILLTGHFGNWEAATVAALQQFPQYRGKFHFLRRALKPAWFDHYITRRFRRAGFGTLPKRGSMERILELLGEGAIIVFTFDQHAGRPDGIPVEFLGHPAGTFKSLAILALNTGAPVVPACTWREPDGRHVLRFEDPLPLLEDDDVGKAIRQNTRAYNAALERMLLRHPEQWIWMHRRWKLRFP